MTLYCKAYHIKLVSFHAACIYTESARIFAIDRFSANGFQKISAPPESRLAFGRRISPIIFYAGLRVDVDLNGLAGLHELCEERAEEAVAGAGGIDDFCIVGIER